MTPRHPYRLPTRCGPLLASAVATFLLAPTAHALIINNGLADTDGAALYGWDSVGSVGNGSGVYLGNGWFITASHVNPGAAGTPYYSAFGLNGTAYTIDLSTPSAYIYNPADSSLTYASTQADLIVYRVGSATQLPPVVNPVSLPTYSQPAAGNTDINLITTGTWPSPLTQTKWNSSWQAGVMPYEYSGFAWTASTFDGTRRYGTNVTDLAANAGFDSRQVWIQPSGMSTWTYCNTSTFFYQTNLAHPTDPDGNPTPQTEAALINGDSGGGSFTSNKLVGICLYEYSWVPYGQPSTSVVYGEVQSYADTSVYAAAIASATGISEWTSASGGSWTTSGSASGWAHYAYGDAPVPNGAGKTALFLSAISTPQTITVSAPITLGEIDFSNTQSSYTVAGPAAITLDNGGQFAARLNLIAGNHTISAPLILNSDLALTTSTGALTLSGDISQLASHSVTKYGPGSLTLSGNNTFSAFTLSAGTVLAASANALSSPALTLADATTLRLAPALSASLPVTFSQLPAFQGSSLLDIANNSVVMANAASALTTSSFLPHITTTQGPPAAAPGSTIAAAVVTGAEFHALRGSSALFDNASVNNSDLLLKYTYGGDANFDGQITVDDYLALDSGFLLGGSDWAHGDFNGDHTVNYLDYAIIDNNFRNQNGALADDLIALHTAWFGAAYLAALNSPGPALVPEPASLALLAFASTLLLTRPRKYRT